MGPGGPGQPGETNRLGCCIADRQTAEGGWVHHGALADATMTCAMPKLPGIRARPDPLARELYVEHDGLRRRAVVRPPARSAGGSLPLVVVFHGAGGSPELAAYATRFSEAADRCGFVVVYPEGLRPDPDKPADFLRNVACWNNGSGFGYAAQVGADDAGFVARLLDVLLEQWPIDPRRVFATGFSNGAGMSYRVGIELGERFAAIAPVAGHLWCAADPGAVLPALLAISGEDDPICPLAGGPVATPWGGVETLPPMRESPSRWAAWCGCATSPRVAEEDDAAREFVFDPQAGAGGRGEVRWVVVKGCGHTWPGGRRVLAERIAGPHTKRYDATQRICAFFGLCGDGRERG